MPKNSKGRVLVAMSGGVDSAVAAALLVEQGYEVIGATMQVWDYSNCDIEEGSGTCCSSLDVDDARAVADKLEIPFYVLNCETQFREAVIDPFIAAYLQGSTPVPCVNCNTFLKFDHLIKKMHELECDHLATGHYAQIESVNESVNGTGAQKIKITTSADDHKDQTYFLFTLESEILKYLLFPIGHMKKPDVRKVAEEKGLIVARKKDSTGICFVGKGGYAEFVEKNVDPAVLRSKAGLFKRFPSGEVMGEHKGIHQYTYGQGRGFGLDHHEKLFVIKIDPTDNTVWIGEEKYLFKDSFDIARCSFLDEVQEGEALDVKIRYSVKGHSAKIFKSPQGYRVQFDAPQRAITPGQACVFYRGRQLVGGGWIQV
jgi:tRNA-specific 2-thiouridylase